MASARHFINEQAYIDKRKAKGTYRLGDNARMQTPCCQCQKPFFEYVGELRDAKAQDTPLVCPYCKDANSRYAGWLKQP